MNIVDYLQLRFDELSENKLFIGLLMVLVNIGARFIIEELPEQHLKIVKSDEFRKIVIFASVFMATRDIVIAIVVTGIFVVLINEVLGTTEKNNEENKKEGKKGSVHAKQQLDKQIDQLKLIKESL
jgi:hypothetical protein